MTKDNKDNKSGLSTGVIVSILGLIACALSFLIPFFAKGSKIAAVAEQILIPIILVTYCLLQLFVLDKIKNRVSKIFLLLSNGLLIVFVILIVIFIRDYRSPSTHSINFGINSINQNTITSVDINNSSLMTPQPSHFLEDYELSLPPSVNPDAFQTPYGKALVSGEEYSIEEMLEIIFKTYYSRKANGIYRDGYTSRYLTYSTRYDLAVYYADGMLYYAEATLGATIAVKLYYWNDILIACRDYRKDHNLYLLGSNGEGQNVFDSVQEEFSDVYNIGMSIDLE